MTTIDERITRGIAVLDQAYGRDHWMDAMRPHIWQLDMSSCIHCVVGWVVREIGGSPSTYWRFIEQQSGILGIEGGANWSADHGFNLYDHELDEWGEAYYQRQLHDMDCLADWNQDGQAVFPWHQLERRWTQRIRQLDRFNDSEELT